MREAPAGILHDAPANGRGAAAPASARSAASLARGIAGAWLAAASMLVPAQPAEPAPADAAAPAPATRRVAKDLHEETLGLEVTVADLYGRRETRRIPVVLFRPDGPGPFPLAVMNHGRAVAARRPQQGRSRFEPLARHLVGLGFVVMVPTRVGYADTYGDFDPESTGESCGGSQLEPQAVAASDQVLATVAFAKTLPFVDASRWIVVGQSVGGLASVATVWRHPAGLVGGINFSGGTGGDPERAPGRPCRPDRVASMWGARAADARAPMLWLYWQNDLYWGPDNPVRWHAAWTAGGGKAEFHHLPPSGRDGHAGIAQDMAGWAPIVDAWLAGLGFSPSGPVRRDAATSAPP